MMENVLCTISVLTPHTLNMVYKDGPSVMETPVTPDITVYWTLLGPYEVSLGQFDTICQELK